MAQTMSGGDIQKKAVSMWNKVSKKSFKEDVQLSPTFDFGSAKKKEGLLQKGRRCLEKQMVQGMDWWVQNQRLNLYVDPSSVEVKMHGKMGQT